MKKQAKKQYNSLEEGLVALYLSVKIRKQEEVIVSNDMVD